MSRARLVITAVVVEGRAQSEVARCYGVSSCWVSNFRYPVDDAIGSFRRQRGWSRSVPAIASPGRSRAGAYRAFGHGRTRSRTLVTLHGTDLELDNVASTTVGRD